MFDNSNCSKCENIDCLTKCQWMDFDDVKEARIEINKLINEDEDCRILKECMLCFACDEYCPYNSHPFDIINELQEKYQSQNILPAITQNSIDMYKAKGKFVPHRDSSTTRYSGRCAAR